MPRAITDYYRCSEDLVRLVLDQPLSGRPGFFQFGAEAICYGRMAGANPARRVTDDLNDVSSEAVATREGLCLPFDPTEVVDNLRLERYLENPSGGTTASKKTLQSAYYFLRPFLPAFVLTVIQKMYYSR